MRAEQQPSQRQTGTLTPAGQRAAGAQQLCHQQQGKHGEQRTAKGDDQRRALGQFPEHAGQAKHQRAEMDRQQGVARRHGVRNRRELRVTQRI